MLCFTNPNRVLLTLQNLHIHFQTQPTQSRVKDSIILDTNTMSYSRGGAACLWTLI